MLDFLKKIFLKKDENTARALFENKDIKQKGSCKDCALQSKCEDQGNYDYRCDYTVDMSDFDRDKRSILLMDDHEGIVSFLKDDLVYLDEKNIIDLDKINVLTFSSNLAAFNFEVAQRKMKGLNIDWAIIDITLGGSVITKDGNVKYTGVDVYEMILKYNPDVKFIFYTGNNLNPYIKANKAIIDKFKSISGKKIKDYILFKTSLDMNTRRDFISKHLFE